MAASATDSLLADLVRLYLRSLRDFAALYGFMLVLMVVVPVRFGVCALILHAALTLAPQLEVARGLCIDLLGAHAALSTFVGVGAGFALFGWAVVRRLAHLARRVSQPAAAATPR